MKSEQILTLLGAMRDAGGTLGGGELARAVDLSPNAFKRELASLRSDLGAHGCRVVGKTGRGNGYALEVSDRAAFDDYLNRVLPERARAEGRDYNDPENRVHFIIWHLLAPEATYVRMDDLATEMLISRGQLAKDLAVVRDRLAYYGIRIVSRPRHGSCAEGDEVALRLCLSDTLREDFHVRGANTSLSHLARPAYHRSDLGHIEEIVVRDGRDAGYALTDAIVQNLMIHLYVSLRRVRAGHELQLDAHTKAELTQADEWSLAHTIADDIAKAFGVAFGKDEVAYIAMHLSSKRIATAEALDGDVMELVEKMLVAVRDAYHIDLTDDEPLRTTLGMHTAPLVKRLQYGLVFPNPLLDEIRLELMFSYDVAACACEAINERFGCRLAEDEIAYYALHLKVGIENHRRASRRHVLIVTSGGRGNAELVRFGFERHVGGSVAQVDVVNAFELPELDLAPYECVFTTVPLTDVLPKPVYRIAPLFDEESAATVQKALAERGGHASAGHYFRPGLFFGDVDARDREDAIAQVCALMADREDLPHDFADLVCQREELQDTRVGLVAMPGARGVVREQTVIGFAVLRHPVEWNGAAVQVMVVLCLGEDFTLHNRGYYRFIRALARDATLVSRLVRDPRYETLVALFAESI